MISKVYSYLRFSDPKQAAGGSVDRQLQYAQRWAKERGMMLDTSLSMRDEGLSAYHQAHIRKGALGVFLKAVDDGLIPVGSYLIVEGLDRLSRAEPILAQAQLGQIINAGITVVTASDGKEYNREGLKSQPMDLVYSLLVMIRAHEESETKSKRVKASIRRQCEGWIAGTYRGPVRNGKDPYWARWNGAQFELHPEMAPAAREAIRLYLAGYGGTKTLRELNASGIELFKDLASRTSISRMVKNPNLIGIKTLAVDGIEYRLEGYYPPLLSEQEYNELLVLSSARSKYKGFNEIPGIITGIDICRCGYCGAAILGQNIMNRGRRDDGTLHYGHRRLSCSAKRNREKCLEGSVSAEPIEKAIMDYCADQMRLDSLFNATADLTEKQAALAAASVKMTELAKQLTRITLAIMEEDVAPLAFVRKAKEIELEMASLEAQKTAIAVELSKAEIRHTPSMAKEWRKLKVGVLKLNTEDRLKARRLIAETFSKIVIYHKGYPPSEKPTTISLMLISKAGVHRFLEIDRLTGEAIKKYDAPSTLRSLTSRKNNGEIGEN